ncbi:hypothetical protein [Synechococcus sp. HK01-R]|uniref:hypothetical protein n=1 Tax=Synechococcus sp. HK01-R TaxID=2751171 RepID=UPI0016276920|nr:hypothetical protein [Synechococcus sp. HK01-R]QNG27914.1 hypothetical protein H0O21_04950 [Synechococcus sp. HK01-R]
MGHGAICCQRGFQAAGVVAVASEAGGLVKAARELRQLPFVLQDQITAVSSLFRRYDNVPASLTDADLIRLSEINASPCRLATDRDFQIYRRHVRQVIPLISP